MCRLVSLGWFSVLVLSVAALVSATCLLPEPSSVQFALAAVVCLLLLRVGRAGLGCRAMVKSTPVAGGRAMRCVFATLAAIALQFATALPDAAAGTLEYSFTTFEFPGADGTALHGINNAGVLVGSYSLGGTSHGFVFDEGVFTTIDVPNAAGGTHPADISDQGQIVGGFFSEALSFVSQGFLFDGANYEVINFPGAASTTLTGINNDGQFVGNYADVVGHVPPVVTDTGFTFDGASFETVAYPGAGHTSVLGINNLGTMVGWSGKESGFSISGTDGFLFDGVDFELFDNPGARTTTLWDINDQGDIVGVFTYDINGELDVERPVDLGRPVPVHGFVRTLDGGLIVSFPDATSTYIRGINNDRTIVGFSMNRDGQIQAFVGTPVPEPSSLCLFLCGCLAACSRRVSRSSVRRRSGEC